MILAVDIGNTNIVLGILDGDTLINECRLYPQLMTRRRNTNKA